MESTRKVLLSTYDDTINDVYLAIDKEVVQHGAKPKLVEGTAALSFRDIRYSVQVKRKQEKVIVNEVSGYVQPGQLLALMGSSGAGKSSLLDLLAGRVRTGKRGGEVMINGQKEGFKLKHIASYVMQDDALHAALTVEENISFSAKLRLPQLTKERRAQRVDETIQQFGLAHIRNSLVGNALIRGISGGERRRVSIAVEAVRHPRILFLDEPTSGLDSAAAFNICRTLKTLAQTHLKTVIATIHQPSTEVYDMFDTLLLLSRGRAMYFGPRGEAPAYFATLGYKMPPLCNPADYILQITNIDFFEDRDAGLKEIEKMAQRYRESDLYTQTLAAIDGLAQNAVAGRAGAGAEARSDLLGARKHGTQGSMAQTMILTHRALVDASRNLGVYWIRLAMYIMMAVMFGLFWWDLSLDQYDVENRLNVVFMCVAFTCFMAVAAVPSFIEDRAIYLRERMNGAITVWPYVLSQTLVSLPFMFLIALIFTGIMYPMCNFHDGADKFFTFTVFLWLALLVAEAMTVAVSAILPQFIAALAVCAALNGGAMVAGGVLVSIHVMPKWLQWSNYLSYQKYAFEAIVHSDLTGLNFDCTRPPLGGGEDCHCAFGVDNGLCQTPGGAILVYLDYEDVRQWEWALVLLGMYAVFRLVYYFTLLFKGTHR